MKTPVEIDTELAKIHRQYTHQLSEAARCKEQATRATPSRTATPLLPYSPPSWARRRRSSSRRLRSEPRIGGSFLRASGVYSTSLATGATRKEAMNFKDLAIKDLGADAHPEDVAYHVAWLRSLSRQELRHYVRKLRG